MRKVSILTGVGAALAGLLTLGLGGPPAGATVARSWSTTATHAESLVDATDLGAAPAATPLRLAVGLAIQNRGALDDLIASGSTVTRKQFVAQYAPSSAQAHAVAAYLTREGLTNVTVAANRLLVTADATAATAGRAFNTPIHEYVQHGVDVVANTAAAQVPGALGSTVAAVVGLNTAGVMHLGATATPAAANPPADCIVPGVGYPCTYNPQGFWQAYDATSAPTGSASKIAIFAEGDVSTVVTDLRTEETANRLHKVAVTTVPTGPASTDTLGLDEWDMDTQYSTGMAATVKRLYLYDGASLNDSDIASEFNRFASDNKAIAGSASFGECEFQAYLDGSMLVDDQAFAEAAAQGQTVFASGGDTGGFCPVGVGANGVPAGAPDVNYPAASPWVIGVGGTTLVTNADGTYDAETAWAAGGGGPSTLEPAPAWTSGIAPPVTVACSELVDVPCGRAVPDIAMDADPDSGANVYVGGTPEGVGGTSLSSPLALGVWARLQSAHANGLGFAGPKLFAANATAAFHDIILGDTGPYPATPGADYATGIGTFDVAQAATLIQ